MRMPTAGFMPSFENVQVGIPVLSLASCLFLPGVSCECRAGGGLRDRGLCVTPGVKQRTCGLILLCSEIAVGEDESDVFHEQCLDSAVCQKTKTKSKLGRARQSPCIYSSLVILLERGAC